MRSSSRELLQNALEHGGEAVRIELAQRNGDVMLAIADDGGGIAGDAARDGALDRATRSVRDELGGTLSLEDEGGLRAEVVFPGLESAGGGDELRVGCLVARLGRPVLCDRTANEAVCLEVLERERKRARPHAEPSAELGEAARLVQLREHGQRPFLQADILVAGERREE